MPISLFKPHREIYRKTIILMIPMILQNIISQVVTLSDTFMVGMLGEQYLSAITIATTPLFVFTVFIFGVQSGAGILVAQYWGNGDKDAINRVIGIGTYFSAITTFAGALLFLFFPQQILGLITNDRALVEIAVPYARISGLATALNAVSLTYIACQCSMENTRFGFIVLSISAVLSVIGKSIFIFGNLGMPELGITGAALSTLFARFVEVGIVTIHAFRQQPLAGKDKAAAQAGSGDAQEFCQVLFACNMQRSAVGIWHDAFSCYPWAYGRRGANPGSVQYRRHS